MWTSLANSSSVLLCLLNFKVAIKMYVCVCYRSCLLCSVCLGLCECVYNFCTFQINYLFFCLNPLLGLSFILSEGKVTKLPTCQRSERPVIMQGLKTIPQLDAQLRRRINPQSENPGEKPLMQNVSRPVSKIGWHVVQN